MDGDEWKGISAEAKAVIDGLLVVDPAKRMTALDCAHHAWLADNTRAHGVHLEHFCTNYSRSILRRKFQAAVFVVIAANRFRKMTPPRTAPAKQEELWEDSTLETKS